MKTKLRVPSVANNPYISITMDCNFNFLYEDCLLPCSIPQVKLCVGSACTRVYRFYAHCFEHPVFTQIKVYFKI